MGAVAGVLFFLFLLAVGFVFTIVSLIFLIILTRKERRGMKYRKALIAVCSAGLAFGIAAAALPIGFFGFIIHTNSTQPEEYVETAVTIEETGYQDKRFTADGTVYVSLGLEYSGYFDKDDKDKAVFSYKEPGFMNRAQWGNYYRVDNPHGFDLVSDEYGKLFCPEEDKKEIRRFYKADSSVWYIKKLDDDSKYYSDSSRIDESVCAELEKFFENPDGYADETLKTSGDYTEISVDRLSGDGVVVKGNYWLAILNSQLYDVQVSEPLEGGGYELSAKKLPDGTAKPLLDLYDSLN